MGRNEIGCGSMTTEWVELCGHCGMRVQDQCPCWPDGCVCDSDVWDWPVTPICDTFVPENPDSIWAHCATCGHDLECHQ